MCKNIIYFNLNQFDNPQTHGEVRWRQAQFKTWGAFKAAGRNNDGYGGIAEGWEVVFWLALGRLNMFKRGMLLLLLMTV